MIIVYKCDTIIQYFIIYSLIQYIHVIILTKLICFGGNPRSGFQCKIRKDFSNMKSRIYKLYIYLNNTQNSALFTLIASKKHSHNIIYIYIYHRDIMKEKLQVFYTLLWNRRISRVVWLITRAALFCTSWELLQSVHVESDTYATTVVETIIRSIIYLYNKS